MVIPSKIHRQRTKSFRCCRKIQGWSMEETPREGRYWLSLPKQDRTQQRSLLRLLSVDAIRFSMSRC